MTPDVVTTSAAVLTLASVPPLPAPPAENDAGTLEASLTLESLSMPVLTVGVLGTGQVAQLPGSMSGVWALTTVFHNRSQLVISAGDLLRVAELVMTCRKYICIHTYIYIYICIHTYIYIYIYMYICMLVTRANDLLLFSRALSALLVSSFQVLS